MPDWQAISTALNGATLVGLGLRAHFGARRKDMDGIQEEQTKIRENVARLAAPTRRRK